MMRIMLCMRVFIVFVFLLGGAKAYCEPEAIEAASDKQLTIMLERVKKELDARGITPKEKQTRMQKAKGRFKRLFNRVSWKNAAIGSVLTAAVTAHPAGLVVGGLAGVLVGKGKRVEKSEAKIAEQQQSVNVDTVDVLTKDDEQVAVFTGDNANKPLQHKTGDYQATSDLTAVNIQQSPASAAAPSAINSSAINSLDINNASSGTQASASNVSSALSAVVVNPINLASNKKAMPSAQLLVQKSLAQKSLTQAQLTASHAENRTVSPVSASQPQPAKRDLTSCYVGGTDKKRERPPHCFYMMY